MRLPSVTTVVLLLAAAGSTHAARSSKPWMEQIKVTLGPPVVVAQTEEVGFKWGIWQFPTISQPEPGKLLLAFNTNEDRPHDKLADLKRPGTYSSADGGKTWRPCDPGPGFTSLYGPEQLCLRKNGDVAYIDSSARAEIPSSKLPKPLGVHRLTYTLRDPLQLPAGLLPQPYLMVKHTGSKEWTKSSITIDDPDSGQTSFDPSDKDYVVMGAARVIQTLELPDRSLLAIRSGLRLGSDRKPMSQWATWCLRSIDGGKTWKFRGMIASDDDNSTQNGYCEPCVTALPDGSLLAALRTEGGWEVNQRTGILCLAQSYDGGQTWSKARAVNPFGVFPQLLTLKNGVTVMSFGRPGVNILYNVDGRGERWQGLTLLVNEGQRFTRTSGYTSLVATGPDRFMIAYDQFDHPNPAGEPRKTILAREVVVTKRAD